MDKPVDTLAVPSGRAYSLAIPFQVDTTMRNAVENGDYCDHRPIICVILISCLLAGCLSAAAGPDAVPLATGESLLSATAVRVRSFHVNGAEPPGRIWDLARVRMDRAVGGEITIEEPVEMIVEADGYGRLYGLDAAPPRVPEGTYVISIYFVPNLVGLNRGVCFPHSGGFSDIILNEENIRDTANFFVSEERVWELTLLHELGHALGVPARRDHVWSGVHCTHPRCLMYPRPDTRSILAGILCLGPPDEFCDRCWEEIESPEVRDTP